MFYRSKIMSVLVSSAAPVAIQRSISTSPFNILIQVSQQIMPFMGLFLELKEAVPHTKVDFRQGGRTPQAVMPP
jgi:hypothetical protein